MDGKTYIDNDYLIEKSLRKNNVTKLDVLDWLERGDSIRKEELGVNLGVWRKSIEHHFPPPEVDAVFFAHPANFSIVEDIQKDFNKILFPLQPKTKVYSRDSWYPLDSDLGGSLHFETHDRKEVLTTLGFLVVTSEFCEEEWKLLAGQPFFQNALYQNKDTIIPICVYNPRKMKGDLPLGIKCLRSVDYYNKDDIICQKTIKNLLQPLIKRRVKEEKEKIRNQIFRLYEYVISTLPPKQDGYTWTSGPHSEYSPDSAYTSGSFPNDGSQSYQRFPSNVKKERQSYQHFGSGLEKESQQPSQDSGYSTGENGWAGSKPSKGPQVSVPSGGPTEYYRSPSLSADRQMGRERNCNTVTVSESGINLTQAPPLDFSSLVSLHSNSRKAHHRDTARLMENNQISAPDPAGRTPSSRNRYDVHGQHSANTSHLEDLNTKPGDKSGYSSRKQSSPDILPIPQEVACQSFGNISLNSNDSFCTNNHNTSENRDLSSSSDQSKGISSDVSITSEENQVQRAFRQPPIARPVFVGDTNYTLHTIDSATNSQTHTNSDRPLPQPVGIKNLPSVNLTNSFISQQSVTSEAASNISSVHAISNIQPQPVPTKISLDKLPSGGSWNNVQKTPPSSITSVPDVSRLPFGCFVPSDEFHDKPSFSSTSFSGKKIGVVKPFSSFDDDGDSDNDQSYVNDLSFPSEETSLKTI
ncbi:uncharacterized protein LOC111129142 [Crassostrea virginica]